MSYLVDSDGANSGLHSKSKTNKSIINSNKKSSNRKRVSIVEPSRHTPPPLTTGSLGSIGSPLEDIQDLSHSSSVGSDSQTLVFLPTNHSSDESGIESTESDSLLRTKTTKRLKKNKKSRGKTSILCCLCVLTAGCLSAMVRLLFGKKQLKPRTVYVRGSDRFNEKLRQSFPANIVRNQKYNILTFLPIVLFNQFKFFLNLYFLLMACSQFINSLKVGYLYTYWAPLGFVLGVTLLREAVDDILRFKRDKAVNSQLYQKLTRDGPLAVHSSRIKVGDLIVVSKDQRVPADMVFLRTSERNGACFVRTDQLDGETDWKLRLAVSSTQGLESDDQLFSLDAYVDAEEPRRDIHSFNGKFTLDSGNKEISLNIENTLWANTVIASGTAIGIVIYTGPETRSMMNNNEPRSKVGLLDYEVNSITKVLFAAVVILAFAMICLKGFNGPLRVNLEMGRVVYSYMIQRDMEIPGTLVRTTTIPEDLGRIAYLLTDKTGTLTRNEMVFKKIHLGKISYSPDLICQCLIGAQRAPALPPPVLMNESVHGWHDGVHVERSPEQTRDDGLAYRRGPVRAQSRTLRPFVWVRALTSFGETSRHWSYFQRRDRARIWGYTGIRQLSRHVRCLCRLRYRCLVWARARTGGDGGGGDANETLMPVSMNCRSESFLSYSEGFGFWFKILQMT
ncbi:unnamed protein product, partial [Oppiella nova]